MDLEALRKEINGIDDQIARLIAERMTIVGDVAAAKQANGTPTLDKSREREILARVTEHAGENEKAVRAVFQLLFDISRAKQSALSPKATALTDEVVAAIKSTDKLFPEKATVAVQGTDGAFSQQAADKLFPLANITYFGNFASVFGAVQSGLCRFGVLPLENSTFGTVGEVYDLMLKYNFHIVRGLTLHVGHSFLAKTGAKLSDIKEVVSHEQAIGQCREYLAKLPKEIEIREMPNTALAAKYAAEHDGVAAIASSECAKYHSLDILTDNIQDNQNNYTRFICITRDLEIYPGSDKVSVSLSLPHEPGSLYALLGKFAASGFNLHKLESRPVPGKDFEFRFYFDFAASLTDEKAARFIGELSKQYGEFRFFGNYLEK
ncbi:MAG: chorismate mutase [Oscillospiraceae bacterium]|nr:chorismate mutase [Oscillospiraceae bacterium]